MSLTNDDKSALVYGPKSGYQYCILYMQWPIQVVTSMNATIYFHWVASCPLRLTANGARRSQVVHFERKKDQQLLRQPDSLQEDQWGLSSRGSAANDTRDQPVLLPQENKRTTFGAQKPAFRVVKWVQFWTTRNISCDTDVTRASLTSASPC